MNKLKNNNRHLLNILKDKDKLIKSREIDRTLDDLTKEDISTLYKDLLKINLNDNYTSNTNATSTIANNNRNSLRNLLDIKNNLLSLLASPNISLNHDLSKKLRNLWLAKNKVDLSNKLVGNYSDNGNQQSNTPSLDLNLNVRKNFIQIDKSQRQTLLTKFNDALDRSNLISTSNLPILQVANEDDWNSLLLSSVNDNDLDDILTSLNLIHKSNNHTLSPTLLNSTLKSLSKTSNIDYIKSILKHCQSNLNYNLTPLEYSHIVECHINSNKPSMAWSVTKKFENENIIVPQSTYSNLIKLHLNNSQPKYIRERGWNLFLHTRLIAYPIPDIKTYSSLFKSCGEGFRPDFERALDLYHELKNYNLSLNEELFSSLISTLAKSHKFNTHDQIFKIFNEMLDYGIRPTSLSLEALLESCKRSGNIKTCRLLLGNWLKLNYNDQNSIKLPNDKTLSKFFFTYSSNRPPHIRVKERQNVKGNIDKNDNENNEGHYYDFDTFTPDNLPVFANEIINESDQIFLRILKDLNLYAIIEGNQFKLTDGSNVDNNDDSFRPFKFVKLSTQLLNSFISIRLNHSTQSVESTLKFVNDLFTDLKVDYNGYTYTLILEHIYKNYKSINEINEVIDNVVNQFKEYMENQHGNIYQSIRNREYDIEKSINKKIQIENDIGVNSSSISRVYAIYISIKSLIWDLDGALNVLKDFVSIYPPDYVNKFREFELNNQFEATTIKLDKELLPDLNPHLTFNDVRMLHERLVTLIKVEDEGGKHHKKTYTNFKSTKQALGFLTWCLKAYDGNYRSFINQKLKLPDRMGVKIPKKNNNENKLTLLDLL